MTCANWPACRLQKLSMRCSCVRGCTGATYRAWHSVSPHQIACSQADARSGAASAGCAGNRQTARCSRQTPARGAVGPRQSGESAAFVPQMRTRACDRNRLTSISNVVMARDFWLQALESSCVIASRTSTGVREIPLGSPRVLETFWARSGRDTNRGVNMELQKPELAAALTSPARTSSAAGLRSLNYGVDRY